MTTTAMTTTAMTTTGMTTTGHDLPAATTTVGVIGAGYVGLTSAVGLAALGHTVTCVEIDPARLAVLAAGGVPIAEPGIAELMAPARAAGLLRFTADIGEGVAGAQVVLLCVATPPGELGEPDLRQLGVAARQVSAAATGDLVVAVKSTVPPGTCEAVELICGDAAPEGVAVRVVSNPEFLREGRALADFLHPDRVVIGGAARDVVAALYPAAWTVVGCDLRSAELVKYAANTFLATKISFANEVAGLCGHLGADAATVLAAVGLDPRVGPDFLVPGAGFGGACLPKDVAGLVATAAAVGYDTPLATATLAVNVAARERIVDDLGCVLGPLHGRRIAVLGLAFKPGTDDTRDSPALAVADALAACGAVLVAYDPGARAVPLAGDRVGDPYTAATGADAVVVLTGWPEFGRLDLHRLGGVMSGRVVLDATGLMNADDLDAAGLELVGVGRGTPTSFHPVITAPLGWATHGQPAWAS